MVGTCGFYPVRGGIRHRVLRRSVYGRSGTSSGGISAQLAVGCQLEGEVSDGVLTGRRGARSAGRRALGAARVDLDPPGGRTLRSEADVPRVGVKFGGGYVRNDRYVVSPFHYPVCRCCVSKRRQEKEGELIIEQRISPDSAAIGAQFVIIRPQGNSSLRLMANQLPIVGDERGARGI
uniref:Uncharacterized protein n=1 Tax=Branchiostoma floridae TaxID=7739 RepID=C3ZE74_BRAFL|eukprot:XP_002593019.1 hypothetical protein BRAFLDRAFT_74338 [Branchiostoma floridae]